MDQAEDVHKDGADALVVKISFHPGLTYTLYRAEWPFYFFFLFLFLTNIVVDIEI